MKAISNLIVKAYAFPRFITLLVLSSLFGLFTLIQVSDLLSCILTLIQNMIFPFIGASFLMRDNSIELSDRLKVGIISGGVIGIIPAFFLLLIEDIRYLSTGAPDTTIEIILLFQIALLLSLTGVSALSGAVAAIISKRP